MTPPSSPTTDDDASRGFRTAEARGVTKIFGRQRALHKVDLSLKAGTITALLGPNGAGKTTLLSLFSFLLRRPHLLKRYINHVLDRLIDVWHSWNQP